MAGDGVHWVDSLSMRWERVRDAGECWRLLTYCFVHHSPWHSAAGVLGIYVAGRAVEPLVGPGRLLGAGFFGTLAGALASCGMSTCAGFARTAGAEGAAVLAGGVNAAGIPLLGALPMLAALVGVYSALLPGWRMGAASRLGIRCAMPFSLTAGAFGWLAAVGCALWWASGWFPEAGPAPMLAGLAAGWIFTRAIGFGEPLWARRKFTAREAGHRNVEEMDWEEFLRTELNPVLDKISDQGIKSLTRAEWRVLQQSRRKLEGW